MATERSDWSTLPGDVIREVVGLLKRTQRWSRDGRSLRSINRHWCTYLNGLIVDVYPHSSRVLHDCDIDSLSKFTNLISLDAAPFEGTVISQREMRCVRLQEVLSKLPHLTHLCTKNLIRHLKVSQLEFLKSVRHLDFERSRCIEIDELSKLTGFQISGITGIFLIKALTAALPNMPFLKSLLREHCNWEPVQEFHKFVPETVSLDSVSLSIDADWLDMSLWDMRNLVSLKITTGIPQTMEPLMGLLRLTSLSLSIESPDIFVSEAFLQLVKTLRSLTIHGNGMRLPDSIFDAALSMETLCLRNLNIGSYVMGAIQKLSLKSLSLLICKLNTRDCSFTQKLTSLQQLTVEYSWNPTSFTSLLMPMEAITNLSLMLDECFSPISELFVEIGYLTSLETLMIHTTGNWSTSIDFEILKDLPHLRCLRLSGWDGIEVLRGMIPVLMLLDLEELRLEGLVNVRHISEGHACLAALKLKAANLKFEYEITESKRQLDFDQSEDDL